MSNNIGEKLAKAQQMVEEVMSAFSELHKDLRGMEDRLYQTFRAILEQSKLGAEFKKEELDSFLKLFLKRPYGLVPKKEGEWYLWVPKIFPLNVGWFDREEGAYNVFIVNRYVDFIQPIPDELKQILDLRRPFDGITVKGERLIIQKPDIDDVKKVFKRYRENLSVIVDRATIRVRPRRAFQLIAAIIRDGILPFSPQPVDLKDLLDRRPKFELRDYQARDMEKFMEYGAVGVFYPMGQGKTNFALYAMCKLKGHKLVLVPNETLREQWLERVQQLTTLDESEYEIVIYHPSQIRRLMKEEWTLVVYDEMHALPANTYLELATLKTRYRINLTGTPFREDGRIDLIWALSGFPLGVDWNYFIARGLIKKPEIEVIITRDVTAKFKELEELIGRSGKTVVFSDSLDYGKTIASQYNIPFIYGQTRNRLDTIRSNDKLVMSRVGDLGIGISKLQRVVEFDFLFGSRRQELQRLGRLFHSEYRGEHIVLMTAEEYARYRKRLHGIYEKGFKIKITQREGVPEYLSMLANLAKKPQEVRSFMRRFLPSPPPTNKETAFKILLDEREVYTPKLVIKILQEARSRGRSGLTVGQINDILRDNHIVGIPQQGCKDTVGRLFGSHRINGRTLQDGRRAYFL